ncbi:CHAT domain-containing protein [Microbacterium aurum]
MTSDPAGLYTAALTLTNERRYREAEAALDAAASGADDNLRARIAGTRAFVLDQLGRPDEGEALCRRVLAGDALTAHTRGVIEGQLGSILMHRGRLDEGLEWLGRAIDTIPDDPLAVANLRMNRSLVAMQRGQLAAATVDLEAAVAAYERHGDPVEVAEARHNLGYTALLGGDLVRAMREMGAARPVIAAASAANAAIGDVDMAEALREAGLVTEAERLLREAARAFHANGMPQARAEAELHLARSLLRHDPAEAARVAGRAARHFTALGARSWAHRARGVQLRAQLSGGTIDRAGRAVADLRVDERDVAPVAASLTRAGLRSDAIALRLTRELWRARHGRSAGRVPTLDETAPLEVRMLAHEVRAERAARAGRDAQARRHAASGIDELATWRASFGSLDLQTSLAMHGSTLMLTGLRAAVRSRRPDVVFEWSERARHLSVQVVPLRPPPDPEQAADLSELRLLRADAAGDDWTSDPRAIALGERLRRRQWTTTGAADLERPVDLPAAAGALDAETALLSYVFTGDGVSCVVVTAAGAALVDLAGWAEARTSLPALRSDLDMSAAVRSGPMAGVVRASLQKRLERLSALIVDRPLAATGGAAAPRRVVITAPGVLAGLPWAMLPGLEGRAVTLATSMSHWVGGRAAVGTVTPSAAGSAPAAFAVGPRVARGMEEATRAAGAWDAGVVLSGAAATVDAVAAAAATSEVLHISAHGRHALDNPLFSGLQLADGALFGYDIDRMPTVPRTVVLSACESGRSAVRWGEEAVGMTRAWLHAGAGAVVAAPVVVADDDACELLAALHTGLAAGEAPAVALAAASARTGIRSPFLVHGNGF